MSYLNNDDESYKYLHFVFAVTSPNISRIVVVELWITVYVVLKIIMCAVQNIDDYFAFAMIILPYLLTTLCLYALKANTFY